MQDSKGKIKISVPNNDHLKGMFGQALTDASQGLKGKDKLKLPQGMKQVSKPAR